MVVYYGEITDSPLSQLIRLQNKAVKITNDTPLGDSNTPYYVNSGLPKCRDNVKLHTCLFLYLLLLLLLLLLLFLFL